MSSAPTFIYVGAIATDLTGGASITPTPGTHQTDDILLALGLNAGNNAQSTATGGWNLITEMGLTTAKIALWWKRATAAGNAGPTITAAGTDEFCCVYVIRGCIKTGTPFEDAQRIVGSTGSSVTFSTVTQTGGVWTHGTPNIMALMVGMWNGATTITSGMPPAGWTQADNTHSASGTQMGFGAATKVYASIGTDITMPALATLAAATENGGWTLGFLPIPDPQPPEPRMKRMQPILAQYCDEKILNFRKIFIPARPRRILAIA